MLYREVLMKISITVTTQDTDHTACCHTEECSDEIKPKHKNIHVRRIYARLKTRLMVLILFWRRRVFGTGNFLDDR